jgi:hypothetical protein
MSLMQFLKIEITAHGCVSMAHIRRQKLMLDNISKGIYGLKVQGFLCVQRWWTTPQ